jgi:hypothetical protein
MNSSLFAAETHDIKELIKNRSEFDQNIVVVKGYLVLKGEERALYPCADKIDFAKEEYVYMDLFTMQPNNKNFEAANKIANHNYKKYEIYHGKCVIVDGTFSINNAVGREQGNIVVNSIELVR